MSNVKLSPVQEFCRIARENACAGTGHSWMRINTAMRQSLQLAISGGFKWELDDFDALAKTNWFGWATGESAEMLYSLAVAEGNESAAKSFEAFAVRGPYFADNVRIWAGHNTQCRQQDRLAVGSQFIWKGASVKVTSFGDGHVVACSYKPQKNGQRGPEKVSQRFSITVEDIRQERAERKRRAELRKKIVALGEKERASVLKAIGVKTDKAFDATPIGKIEKALEKCGVK